MFRIPAPPNGIDYHVAPGTIMCCKLFAAFPMFSIVYASYLQHF